MRCAVRLISEIIYWENVVYWTVKKTDRLRAGRQKPKGGKDKAGVMRQAPCTSRKQFGLQLLTCDSPLHTVSLDPAHKVESLLLLLFSTRPDGVTKSLGALPVHTLSGTNRQFHSLASTSLLASKSLSDSALSVITISGKLHENHRIRKSARTVLKPTESKIRENLWKMVKAVGLEVLPWATDNEVLWEVLV